VSQENVERLASCAKQAYIQSDRIAQGRKMTKHKGFIAVCLVLALAALSTSSALGAAGGTDRPLHGTVSGTVSGTFQPGHFSGEGSGHLAHLGKVTMTIEGTLVPVGQFEAQLSGTIVFVSTTGDELTGTFSGVASSFDGSVGLAGTITGGTGRFEDASGSFGVVGSNTIIFNDGNNFIADIEFPFTGAISY
jgi:hypothetical protein